MAYDADVYEALRRATGEVDSDTYSDTDLDYFLDKSAGEVDPAAGLIWREKASSYAEMVDISEAGSSRKNSDLYKNAIAMAKWYEDAGSGDLPPAPGTYSTTRAIVRQ